MATQPSNLLNLEKAKNLMHACVKENGYVMQPLWKEQGELIKKFEVRPDDVWIMTLPRSGTTVTQEIVYLLMNDFDFKSTEEYPFYWRVQAIGASLCPKSWANHCILVPNKDNSKKLDAIPVDNTKSSPEVYASLLSPRICKSHLPFSVLPNILKSGAKTIYVARNPKDRLISWSKILPLMGNVQCDVDFATFWRYARDEKILFEPTWKHIKEGWAQRNNPNVLFLFYEEIRADLQGVIKRIAEFLGKSITDKQMEQTLRYLDIDNFRNTYTNAIKLPKTKEVLGNSAFIGKGRVNGYKDMITPEVEKEMDEWIEENLCGTDIIFPGIND